MNADDLLVEADALQQRGDPLGEVFALTAAIARDRADRGAIAAEIRLLSTYPALHLDEKLARIREARRMLLGHGCWHYEYHHLVRATHVALRGLDERTTAFTVVALGQLVFRRPDAIAFTQLISDDASPLGPTWADEPERDDDRPDRPDPRDHLVLGHAHWQVHRIERTQDRLDWMLVVDVYVRPTRALVERGTGDPRLLAALRNILEELNPTCPPLPLPDRAIDVSGYTHTHGFAGEIVMRGQVD